MQIKVLKATHKMTFVDRLKQEKLSLDYIKRPAFTKIKKSKKPLQYDE